MGGDNKWDEQTKKQKNPYRGGALLDYELLAWRALSSPPKPDFARGLSSQHDQY